MAIGLKFCIKKVEGLYYPCSENKGADQLRGHREADLRLCFRICKSRFSPNEAHMIYTQYIKKRNTYIFADNLNNFKGLHFKLAGHID